MTITHDDASRIAAAITFLRPDWPQMQVVRLCNELKNWSLLDLAVGLTYVAVDRNGDGSWASKSPYRVREQGPWRIVGLVDPDRQSAHDRTQRELDAARQARDSRLLGVELCDICDADGRIPNGNLCHHDERSLPDYRSPGASVAQRALADARRARLHARQETTDA